MEKAVGSRRMAASDLLRCGSRILRCDRRRIWLGDAGFGWWERAGFRSGGCSAQSSINGVSGAGLWHSCLSPNSGLDGRAV